MEALEPASEPQASKKRRHRKKQLYASILKQMEFYFGDANLSKDRFLSQHLATSKFVPLELFLKFNKIRKFTGKVEDVRRAVRNSALIELADDEQAVARRTPFRAKPDIDACTVYVEGLPAGASHESLAALFAEFGRVDYVSIPRFRRTRAVKGFAFVEFGAEAEARGALAFFETIDARMPSNVEPEALCSISTFEGGEKDVKNEGRKRNFNQDETEEAREEEVVQDEKRIKLEEEAAKSDEDDEGRKKKKLKKEQKRKASFRDLGLQVLSKQDWKKIRNRYLELQRKKMKEYKRFLHKARFGQANYSENEGAKEEESQPKLEFVKGVIVKVKLAEPCAEVKRLKNEVKLACTDVKFVDVPHVNCEAIYLRFNDSQAAEQYQKQDGFGEKSILAGDEETSYWEKIEQMRVEKFKKSNKKERGRDKLLRKANKVQAQHIKFDE